MRVTLAAIALACLANCADTTPPTQSSSKKGGKRFTLTQVHNDKFQGHDTPSSFLKAHLKYGHTLPPQLSRALDLNPSLKLRFQAQLPYTNRSQKGTIKTSIAPKYDSEYSVPVQIGTPPQTIPLNLDTGSADLWTFSSETYPTVVMNQTLYHPENSSTCELQRGESWQVKYGDGAGAAGIVYRDRVQVGETYVDGQGVQAAITVSPEIARDSFTSGILGMANSRVNTARPMQQRTYIDNIRGSLEEPLFTANLRNRRPGNYNFGYIDKSEYTGDLQYAAVNRYSPFWMVTVNGYQVGYNPPLQVSWNAIVDTGTSLLLLPDEIVQDYYRHVPGAGIDPKLGVVTFPCQVHPPDFFFYIGAHRGRIPGAYINYGQVSETYCHGGIQTARGLPFGVLGDVVLKAQFIVFNYNLGLVGFANKKLDDAPDSPPEH
ncbi:eukaryotic aspartyl protease [Hirsutella rhossiliensis]|uniref:Eukaryotic aspartyl protease domain-containing protein n=1 Tax=Hirsutella rhossiliensis TaxID=111463 RepID=A0A9P8SLQ4_9HYPO|nr:eukaryotic aspartyl protease domain-containing protein [Hirsutella rhossiliensis]KAH0966035.1 eukaryotic aspartyl protease domain-containing protein [Hirsutella rhossiliensis]